MGFKGGLGAGGKFAVLGDMVGELAMLRRRDSLMNGCLDWYLASSGPCVWSYGGRSHCVDCICRDVELG